MVFELIGPQIYLALYLTSKMSNVLCICRYKVGIFVCSLPDMPSLNPAMSDITI